MRFNRQQFSPVPRFAFRVPRSHGFTLIEVLVVIAIIAILASLLLPAISRGPVQAKIKQAKIEMGHLAIAIQSYDNDYSRNPLPSRDAESVPADFTFGDTGLAAGNPPRVINGGAYEANNSELMAILVDADRAPNVKHVRNPRKTRFYDPKQVSGKEYPGLSNEDFVLRDPWGGAYVITLDANHDGKCRDGLYRKAAVSAAPTANNPNAGFYGLVKGDPANPDSYELNGSVMIWSAGPDRSFSTEDPANQGVNKDNILSWQ